MPNPPDLPGTFFIGALMIERPIPDYLEKLDERQRKASTIERNCVVTAGAGAGKTTVLATRYIHLVIEKHVPIRSILALTFTRKAAAEMYERIYGELAAQTSPWSREQLDDFQNAHITTLDSFCAEIVRQAARDFGYSPAFSIDDEKCADLAQGIAYRYVLRNRNKPGLKEMLLSFPFDAVAASLFGDLGSAHVTPLALKEQLFSPMKESLASMAAEKAGAAIDHLVVLAKEIIGAFASIASPKADCAAAIACSSAFIEAHNAINLGSPALSYFSPYFSTFAGLAMRSYGRNEAEQTVKALAKKAKEEALNLIDFAAYEAMFPAHCSLLERLDEFASEYAEAKRLADVMDFKDLGACAVRILADRIDIRSYWKKEIESIMIDEFQDNNELQRDLLFLLAERRDGNIAGIPGPSDLEEGKLFFVGDEKQSIYRFRGADVAVFKHLSEDLSRGKTKDFSSDIVLSANYRSSPALIGFFNDFFSSIMADEDGINQKEFCARYSAMEPGDHRPSSDQIFDSQVKYFLVENRENEFGENKDSDDSREDPVDGMSDSETLSADDSLAFEVAQFIERARGNLEVRSEKNHGQGTSPRKADYQDFAILLRTTTHQHRIEKYFRLLNIPFDSESPRSLFRESPANDIYNILSFVQDPENKAAYAALLRSPLCRVSDEAFLRLMTSGDTSLESFAVSEYDAMMLERAKAFLDELRSLARIGTVSDIVEYVWNSGGLRLDILSRPESHSFLEHFDFLYHIAADIDQERGGIADFLARLRPYVEGETEKFDIENVPRASVSGVKILTIHKSKGLQFPVVIIPWVENSGSAKRSQTLWEMLPEGLAVDIKPYDKPGAKADNIFFRLAKSIENEMNVAEIKRLLYVACTRAEDHLFFFGKKPKRESAGESSFQYYLDTFSESVSDCNTIPSASLEKTSLPCRIFNDVRHWYGGRVKPLSEDFERAYAAAKPLDRRSPRRHLSATELNDFFLENGRRNQGAGEVTPIASATETETTFPAVIDEAPQIPPKIFGDICHEAVEWAAKTGSASGYEPSDALAHGLDSANLSQATLLASAMAKNFLVSEFWTSLSPNVEKRTEKPFLLALGAFTIEGRMDLFIESENEAIIIDFKSDSERAASHYRIQMDLYRKAAEGIVRCKKVRTGLYWLRNSTLSWLEPTFTDEDLLALARDVSQATMEKNDDTLGIGQKHA